MLADKRDDPLHAIVEELTIILRVHAVEEAEDICHKDKHVLRFIKSIDVKVDMNEDIIVADPHEAELIIVVVFDDAIEKVLEIAVD